MTVDVSAKLFHAIVEKDLVAMRSVLESFRGAANLSFPGQSSFLHLAAFEGSVEVVRLLIDYGADVNFVPAGSLYCPPLCDAAEAGHLEVMRLLLAAGAYVDGDDRTSITPLMLASREGHDEAVKLLIDRGADVNRLGYVLRFLPLDFAGWKGTDYTKELLSARGGRSVTDEFDWESQSGYPIISHVSNEAGPVYPIGFDRELADRSITLRLAYINVKEEPLVLFTAEVHQMGAPVEYVINLPHRWPLIQTYSAARSALSFPMDLLQCLAALAGSGKVLHEGAAVLRDDPLFADLVWPDKLSALIALDHDWQAASAKGRKGRKTSPSESNNLEDASAGNGDELLSDDEVTMLTLVPVFEGEKIPIDVALFKWLEKKRTASWVKLCLPLWDE